MQRPPFLQPRRRSDPEVNASNLSLHDGQIPEQPPRSASVLQSPILRSAPASPTSVPHRAALPSHLKARARPAPPTTSQTVHVVERSDINRPLPARPVSLGSADATQEPRRSQLPSDAGQSKHVRKKSRNLTIVEEEEDRAYDEAPSSSQKTFIPSAPIGAPTPRVSLNADPRTTPFPPTSSRSQDDSPSFGKGQGPTSGLPFAPPSRLNQARPGTRTAADHRASQLAPLAGGVSANAPRRMLHLMLTRRLRMQGFLQFRNPQEEAWSISYCSIRKESGTLRSEVEGTKALLETLVSDLRSCIVYSFFDREARLSTLHLRAADGSKALYLRPPSQSVFDAWFAAFLCWRTIPRTSPGRDTIQHQHPKPLTIVTQEDIGDVAAVDEHRAELDTVTTSPYDDDEILKAGRATLVQRHVLESRPASSSQTAMRRKIRQEAAGLFLSHTKDVSCVLCRNGELSLQQLEGASIAIVGTVRLKAFPRSAIQRLHKSVLNMEYCIAIYPQYARSDEASSSVWPFYLRFHSKHSFEGWFSLLRSLAIPEMYGTQHFDTGKLHDNLDSGPNSGPSSVLFRIEPALNVRISKAVFSAGNASPTSMPRDMNNRDSAQLGSVACRYDAETLLDGQIRARTAVTPVVKDPIWYDNHSIGDCSSVLSAICVRINRYPSTLASDYDDRSRTSFLSSPTNSDTSLDQLTPNQSNESLIDLGYGEACIDVSELDSVRESEKTWPLQDSHGALIGKVMLKIHLTNNLILMEHEYLPILDLLCHFSNTLTWKVAERMPSHIVRLVDCFLDIFQSTGNAIPWLLSLAEEEINKGSRRAPNVCQGSDSAQRPGSAHDESEQEEDERSQADRRLVSQVSLLFRANTLFTRALDSYMKRIGQTYLEATIGNKLKEIVWNEVDCEVDPNRLDAQSPDTLRAHWGQLLDYTQGLWTLIFYSAPRCPPELKVVFEFIRNRCEARFGGVMPSVNYSSVSGFLFLRFFCPAIMHPQLFNLIDGTPGPRAHRTFVLIAKSLQGLANMTVFGNKEPWMSPMNAFCSSHREEFKQFIDTISKPDTRRDEADPGYAMFHETTSRIIEQLPLPSREGTLSVPHLIDRARSLATLVDLWLSNADDNVNRRLSKLSINGTHTAEGRRSVDSEISLTMEDVMGRDAELESFHSICQELRSRAQSYMHLAEKLEERHDGVMTHRLVALAESMERNPGDFWVPDGPLDLTGTRDSASRDGGGLSPHARRRNGHERKGSLEGRPGTGSSGETGKKPKRKKSPPRNKEENAMRKLGWM